MTYAQKLKHPKWQQKRLKILERDRWTCQLCGDINKTLHVHHLKYTAEPYNEPDEKLITYCEICHGVVSKFKDKTVYSISTREFDWGFAYIAKTDKNFLLGNFSDGNVTLLMEICSDSIDWVVSNLKP